MSSNILSRHPQVPPTITSTAEHAQYRLPRLPPNHRTKLPTFHQLTASLRSKNLPPPSILRHKSHTYSTVDSAPQTTSQCRESLPPITCKRSCPSDNDYNNTHKAAQKKRIKHWNPAEPSGICVQPLPKDKELTEPVSPSSGATLSTSTQEGNSESEKSHVSRKEDQVHAGNVAAIFIQAAQRLETGEHHRQRQQQSEQDTNQDNNSNSPGVECDLQQVREFVKCSVTICQITEEIQSGHVELLCLEKNLVMKRVGKVGKRMTKREKLDESYRFLRQQDNWRRRDQILKEQTERKQYLRRLTKKSKGLMTAMKNASQ